MRNLVLVEIDEEFLTSLSVLRASLALPTLLFTFSSALLVTVMALPYVNLSTSCRSSPFNLILSCRLLLACMPLVFSSLTLSQCSLQSMPGCWSWLAYVVVSEKGGIYHLHNPGHVAEL